MFIMSISGKQVGCLGNVDIKRIEYSKDEVDGVINVNGNAFGTYQYERASEIMAEIIDNCKVNKTFYQLPKE